MREEEKTRENISYERVDSAYPNWMFSDVFILWPCKAGCINMRIPEFGHPLQNKHGVDAPT